MAISLSLLHALLAIWLFDPTPHSGGDNAAYLALARSLLEHGRYLELWDPARSPHAQYPPGLPAILALGMAVGIGPWMGLKTIMVGISTVAVGLSYRWMRDRLSPAGALGAGLLVAAAPGAVIASHWILSDVPFWAATVAALWAAERGRTGWAVGLAFVALTFRAAALPLLIAVVAWLALRGRMRSAAGAAAGFVLLAVVWNLTARAGDLPYASELWMANPYDPSAGTVGVWGLLERIGENASLYTFRFLMRLQMGAAGAVANIFGGGLVAAAAAGWLVSVRSSRIGLAELFAPLYVGVLLLWPTAWASDRFLLPLLPLLLVYATVGLRRIPGRRAARIATAGSVVVLLVGVAPALIAHAEYTGACRQAARDGRPLACLGSNLRTFVALARWSEFGLPADAVVLSRKPTFFYWFSGRPSRTFPFDRDPAAFFEAARGAGARYVIVDDIGRVAHTYLGPVLAEHPEAFCVLKLMEEQGERSMLLGIGGPPMGREPFPSRPGRAAGTVDFSRCPVEYGG